MLMVKNTSEANTTTSQSIYLRNSRRLVSVLAVVLALLMALNSLFFVSARPAHAVTSGEKQAEADAVAAKLNEWQDQLDRASDNYYAALYAREEALAQKDAAQARIEAAQAIISANQQKLGARANSMYKDGPLSYLDVLFGATSFEDFTIRWDFLNSINKENADLIALNKTAKREAEAAHVELTKQERIAAEKLAEAEAIKAEAEQIVAAYEAELAGLEAEVAELVRQEQEAQRQRELAAAAANAGNSQSNLRGSGSSDFPPGTFGGVLDAAYSRVGLPYVWGAEGPDSFDCSGFTTWCYRQAGIKIPHQSEQQLAAASSVLPVSDAQPGDVLWRQGHVGLYLGGGMYIDADPSRGIRIASMSTYSWTYACRF